MDWYILMIFFLGLYNILDSIDKSRINKDLEKLQSRLSITEEKISNLSEDFYA